MLFFCETILLVKKLIFVNTKEEIDFVNTKFDLLINLYQSNALALQVVSAATQAEFKVGLYDANQDLNDLIIETKLDDKTLFKTELIKYLNILNKLSNE